jgi:hypothetical protein
MFTDIVSSISDRRRSLACVLSHELHDGRLLRGAASARDDGRAEAGQLEEQLSERVETDLQRRSVDDQTRVELGAEEVELTGRLAHRRAVEKLKDRLVAVDQTGADADASRGLGFV